MPEPCAAVLTTGAPCPAPGSIPNGAGQLVCYEHADGRLVPHAIRRAIGHPDRYLAAALAEETDASLGALLACAPEREWRLRHMGWPRANEWDLDVQTMVRSIQADPALLAALLHRVGRSDWRPQRLLAQRLLNICIIRQLV